MVRISRNAGHAFIVPPTLLASPPAIVGVKRHPVRDMRDGRVHLALDFPGILELDVIPPGTAARQVDFAIEYFSVPVPRDSDPRRRAPMVGHLLAVMVGDAVKVAIVRPARRCDLPGREGRRTVRADELACPGLPVRHRLGPAARNQAGSTLRRVTSGRLAHWKRSIVTSAR